jgi:IS5 family transposase
MMARRQIGQEELRLVDGTPTRCTNSLDEISGLIDWSEIDRHLTPIYASATGEQGWPPLAMVKALLLSIWYDLSDVKLAEALDDRASFRRFCGFAASEGTPERTAFVRFRRELTARSLDRVLFETINQQLDGKNVMVKTGTLVDATIIASASITKDAEARWVGHRRKAPVHGYKAHVACDGDGGIVRDD